MDIWAWVGIAVAAIFVLILFFYILRKIIQGGQFKNDVKITGKIVIITGANTGIGKVTAIDLASRGAKIYLACRDAKKMEAARLEIIQETGNKNIFARELDLSSLKSIRKFAKDFIEEEKQLDILINNAGIMICPKGLTQDGFETQIGVNHMGHFLLTNLLLPNLKNSAPSRIVVLSSIAHLTGQINKKDLNSEKSYDRIKAYSQSKLANILFTRHLSKMLEGTGVTVNALHPGVVNTELTRHVPAFLQFLAPPFYYLFMKTPKSGAQTSIKCAVDPALEQVTGKYFSDCKEKGISRAAKDDETALWLWKESEKWVGL